MTIDGLSDSAVREILETARNIAVIGVSQNAEKPSNYVPHFLQQKGYRVFPVNPGIAGQTVLGETAYASLAEVPQPIDVVEVFRAAEHLDAIVDEALSLEQPPKVIWMQQGIINEPAAEKARSAGLQVVMDRCPKQEIPRLSPKTLK